MFLNTHHTYTPCSWRENNEHTSRQKHWLRFLSKHFIQKFYSALPHSQWYNWIWFVIYCCWFVDFYYSKKIERNIKFKQTARNLRRNWIKMEGFDDAAIFFSDNFNPDDQNGNQINLQAVKKRFKEFIRTFNEDNFHYKYRWVKVKLNLNEIQFNLFHDCSFMVACDGLSMNVIESKILKTCF